MFERNSNSFLIRHQPAAGQQTSNQEPEPARSIRDETVRLGNSQNKLDAFDATNRE
jgi:hypothetical protein